MRITADKRSIRARRHPTADDRIARRLRTLRDLQIRLARDLARVDADAHFVFSGCASVVEYARKLGFSTPEARMLTNLGKTLIAAPEAEARVRSGEVSVEAAALIGRVLAHPELRRAGDDWLTAAATDPLRVLRRRIRERFELHAQGELGVEEVSVFVTASVKDDFDRAREVASQKAGKPLTDGQTFTRVVGFYLQKNDPLRQKGGTRRLGDTGAMPRSRYIPAEVRRAVRDRSGGACEVPSCDRKIGLQFAHRTPHRHGGGREVDDIGSLCTRHHVLYDAGRIPWPIAPAERGAATDEEDLKHARANGGGVVRERAPPYRGSRREPANPLRTRARPWHAL